VFSIVQAAGWPIWPLLLASIIAVALIIERLVALRRVKVVPPDLLQRVVTEFRQRGATQAMVVDLEAHSPLGRVLGAGLRNVGSSREIMKESIEEAGSVVSHELERYLTTLGTIASISPLMGLFGTVVGMIEIFGSQAPSGSNPMQLAHGISVALYNTGFRADDRHSEHDLLAPLPGPGLVSSSRCSNRRCVWSRSCTANARLLRGDMNFRRGRSQ
jgi:biopolymer transport protein ExbB